MHPDKTLVNDLSIFVLGCLMVLSLVYIMSTSTVYAPADQCAQALRNNLSPYQAQALIESEQMPPRYNVARKWCESNLNTYEADITRASRWPMYPAADMFGAF